MKDLRKYQVIVNQIDSKYRKNLNSVKWDTVYKSESEIVEDLKKIRIPEKDESMAVYRLYTGYEYIHSFARWVQNGKLLTEKQMKQCKRLALEIKKAAAIADCY